MLLGNLDPPKLCNGTGFCVNVIQATNLIDNNKGESVFTPRIPRILTDMPFEFKSLQFPIRLTFSITINNTQDESLKLTSINLETPCFSHGQLYGACSRVGTPRNLHMCSKLRD
ncbi:hypothetical protein AVEN_39139-1 [Araneus ventricosus]|uniref:ATP-dependent DNA helicase n=1 Tax=Araneus ventricosus TaxID=182803 RepID=A0A4Y2RTB9_ARAVE|nr:hypothetical protein AVEN_39139-1 [Araneus ventricosus]